MHVQMCQNDVVGNTAQILTDIGGTHAALPLQGQNSLQQQVSQQQQQQSGQQQQVPQAKLPQQQQQQPLHQQGQAWSGGAGGVARPRSQNLSPISNYNAFHTEQDRWRRDVSEVNNQWVQKLQECAKTNADVQNLLRYYMSLPDVSHVYPVSQDARSMGPIAPAATAASGGAPSTGMGGGTGAASVGALQNGSGALQVQHLPLSMPSIFAAAFSYQFENTRNVTVTCAQYTCHVRTMCNNTSGPGSINLMNENMMS